MGVHHFVEALSPEGVWTRTPKLTVTEASWFTDVRDCRDRLACLRPSVILLREMTAFRTEDGAVFYLKQVPWSKQWRTVVSYRTINGYQYAPSIRSYNFVELVFVCVSGFDTRSRRLIEHDVAKSQQGSSWDYILTDRFPEIYTLVPEVDEAPVRTTEGPNCPTCQAENAYIGMLFIECPNLECRHFSAKQAALANPDT